VTRAARREPPPVQRWAALLPLLAEAGHRADADAVGLVDLVGDASTGAVGVTYSAGQRLGDPAAAVQLTAAVVGPGRPPLWPLPTVTSHACPGTLVELADALAAVPAGTLPLVTTTWALAALSVDDRLRFLQRLDDAATHRTVAWASVEGVGVAPGVPTLGDRRASGHSTLGLTLLEQSSLRSEAVGRCWSRGRHVAWLADAQRD
jgi:hypothetical protein